MSPQQIDELVREQGPFVFERMYSAVEKVRERLERACQALEEAGIPYAVVGGNAVAAWVATKDDGAVRNTQDVDLLLRREDFDRVVATFAAVGFLHAKTFGIDAFTDGPDGKTSQGIHIIWADEIIKKGETTKAPMTDEYRSIDGKRIVDLLPLIRMKLLTYRRKDQVHLLDMIGVGLIDEKWIERLEPEFAARLQALLDDPDG